MTFHEVCFESTYKWEGTCPCCKEKKPVEEQEEKPQIVMVFRR